MATLISLHSSFSSLHSPIPKPLSLPPNSTLSLPPHQSPRLKSLTLTPKSKPLTLTLTPPSATASASSDAVSSAAPSLKSRLRSGDTLYGLFLCSFSPTLAEIAGLSGYDFVVVDMEHGYGGLPEALACLRSLSATATPAILRLPETSAAWAKKALDLGPQGIMFPMIDSPELAASAVSYCRYPPAGVRGAAHPIVRASGYGIDSGYLNEYEDDLLIMCQVESTEAAENAAAIAAVEGVDCVQMGPLDLSASMGYLWDPGNKKVRDTLRKIEKDVIGSFEKNGNGAYLSGFAMPHDSPEQMKSRGYHMVAGAVDIVLFRNAAVEDVKKFKASLEMADNGGGDDGGDRIDGEKDDDDEKYWSE